MSNVTIKGPQIFYKSNLYLVIYCFLFIDEEKEMPTIVGIEYPQLPTAAVKGKYYYHGMLVKYNGNEKKISS